MNNVWDFLGIPEQRKPNKTVMLVKHFYEVNPKADKVIYHKKVVKEFYAYLK